MKYILRQLDNVQGNGLGFDLGLRYRIMPSLTLAASAMNLGAGIKLASLEPLPTQLNTGAAWTALEMPLHSLTFMANGVLNVNTNTQALGVGTEYWYRDLFALRAGYLSNSRDDGFNSSGFSAGAGIRISFLQLDYAFQPYNTLGMVHRVSGILRWDGPWVAGGEPNAPKYVNAVETAGDIEVRWDKSQGPVQSYEVLVQPLDGSDLFVSEPVVKPFYVYKNDKPDTLYRISVRAVNNGIRSFPSNETYLESRTVQIAGQNTGLGAQNAPALAPVPREQQGLETIRVVPPQGIGGNGNIDLNADVVGLRVSWKIPPFATSGYNLYKKSPSNHVEKVTLEPKKSNVVWVTDTSGLQGWEWIVTAVTPDGKSEKALGHFLWYPSPREAEILTAPPVVKLNASPQARRKVFLDWDRNPSEAGYALFVSREPDNVYELFEVSKNSNPNVLLQLSNNHSPYFFMVVPRNADGTWLNRSNEAKVEPFSDVPKQ